MNEEFDRWIDETDQVAAAFGVVNFDGAEQSETEREEVRWEFFLRSNLVFSLRFGLDLLCPYICIKAGFEHLWSGCKDACLQPLPNLSWGEMGPLLVAVEVISGMGYDVSFLQNHLEETTTAHERLEWLLESQKRLAVARE